MGISKGRASLLAHTFRRLLFTEMGLGGNETIRKTAGLALCLALVLMMLLPSVVAPRPAVAADPTTSLTVTKHDADGNVIGTQTVTYQWMEANLPVYGDGMTHYYCEGPNFDPTRTLETLWDPSETGNIDGRDYGAAKGTDVKDLCNLVGGASPGDTIRVKAIDNFSEWFDYENIYTPQPGQGKMVITWYNATFGGYVPAYSTGMRLLFFAETVNPQGKHVFGDWDMHETLPASRCYFYYNGKFWPSSGGLSVQVVSNIDIYQPNLISCDVSGSPKETFAPGDTVYVKGLRLATSTSYKIWIQNEPVVVLPPGGYGVPGTVGHDQIIAGEDPSGSEESVTTDANGDLAPLAIWNIALSATTPSKYDIVADNQAQGTIGTFESKDATDSPGWEGFTVAVPATQPPVAAFSADMVSGAAPLTVNFTDQATGTPIAWAWDFNNDGVVDSIVQNPSHIYSAAGTYTVKLTVTNAVGSDSEVKTDYITVAAPPLPVAAFTADVVSGAAPLNVQFTDQSTGNPTGWAWDFDNDNTVDGTAQNPSHTYDAAGTYAVKLKVTNTAGSDDEVKTDYITVTTPTMALLWGPYLTGTTTTGTVANVKTSLATTVKVQYAGEAEYAASSTYSLTATDGTNTQLHHIALPELDPNTVYHYRVLYGTESTADFHFSTFPTSGAFTFVVLSDTQDELPLFSQSERFKLAADSIAAQPNIAFVLIAGDLVNDGSDLADWDRFFDAGRLMLANTTVYAALGNHDDNATLHYEIFGLSAYYSFDCADAHFTVLDSINGISAQTTWLDNDLGTSKAWKFVAFHYPLYTSDPNHFGGWANLRAEWEGLFQTHGVYAVWNGHVHAYERYLENGIQDMVVGTGGGPLVQLSTEKYDGYQNSLENSLAYAKVTVDPAAGTATVKIVRVADISQDNSEVTTVYPPETVFESVALTRVEQDNAASSFTHWMKAHYIPVVVGIVIVTASIVGVTVGMKARRKRQ